MDYTEITYIVRSGVDLSESGWVCVPYTGHIQFQNVPEPRPQGASQISIITLEQENKQTRVRQRERERERERPSLLQTGHSTTCHDGLKPIVDVNTQKKTNCIITILDIALHMFLQGREEGEKWDVVNQPF